MSRGFFKDSVGCWRYLIGDIIYVLSRLPLFRWYIIVHLFPGLGQRRQLIFGEFRLT